MRTIDIDGGRARLTSIRITNREGGNTPFWHWSIRRKDGTYTEPQIAYSQQCALVTVWERLGA